MTPPSGYQRDLILSLIEGVHESPPWSGFLRQLVAGTQASRAYLVIRLANAPADQESATVLTAAPRLATDPRLDVRRIASLGLQLFDGIRPERAYSLDELLDYDRPAQLAIQRAALDEIGVRYGRVLRASATGAADAWVLLVRSREEFSAAAGATLSAVAPHLAAGLRILAVLIEQRLQVALAQSALRRLGVGQLAFDASGRVLATDTQAEELLSFVAEPGPGPGRRLQLAPKVSQALEDACASLSSGSTDVSLPLPLDLQRGLWISLRKAELSLREPCVFPAAIGALRVVRREDPASARDTLAAMYGLSMNEASLAHQLSMGESIVEAGRKLRLTPETARNYSKRVYAKTGTSSQADLVRLILTGLAPLS